MKCSKCSKCGIEWRVSLATKIHPDYVCPNCRGEETQNTPDSNVEKLREMLLQRSLVGLKKYGVTTDRTDLSLVEWLRHRLEEILDDAVYTMKAITILEEKDALDRAMEIERGKA